MKLSSMLSVSDSPRTAARLEKEMVRWSLDREEVWEGVEVEEEAPEPRPEANPEAKPGGAATEPEEGMRLKPGRMLPGAEPWD
jgi:hypothetical protein